MSEQVGGISIRRAVPGDQVGIARVHVSSWQTSYRGLVPENILENLSVERSAAYWGSQLEGDNQEWTFVAEEEGAIIGFVSGGPFRPEQAPPDFPDRYDSELYAIYLLEAYKRLGIGKRLFRAQVGALSRSGFIAMMLWVLSENRDASHFYEKLGGRVVGEKTEVIGGRQVAETAYGWDLSDLE